MKKLSLILCIVMILAMFAGCGGDSGDGDAANNGGSDGIFSTAAVNYVTAEGEAVYRIVRPEEPTDAEAAAASLLFKQHRDMYGNIRNVSDTSDGSDAYEILLGNTNRPESAQAKSWLVENVGGRYDDYIICTIGKKIVICGVSDEAFTAAVKYFVDNFLSKAQSKGIKYTYTAKENFNDVTVNGANIGKFSIVRPQFNSSYLTYAELEKMVETLYQKSGYRPLFVEDTQTAESEYEIIVGDCERPNVTKIENRDEYKVTISGKKIYINGGSHQATTIAVSELNKRFEKSVALTDADSFAGTYSETVRNYDTSTYYTPRFWDDFDDITGDHVNANGLDTTKWKLTTSSTEGRSGYTAKRATDPEHIFVADGMFHIYPYADHENKIFYGGFLETGNLMRLTYGYIEYSAKIPDGAGFWSAIWLRCNDYSGSSRPEVDIAECFGNSKSFAFNMHTWPGKGPGSEGVEHSSLDGGRYPDKKKICPGDGRFNDTFHTYGMLWTPEVVYATCDGVPYFKYNMGDKPTDEWCFSRLMRLCISLAVGFESGSSGDPLTLSEEIWNTKGRYYVDWVYIYQIDDGNQTMVFGDDAK